MNGPRSILNLAIRSQAGFLSEVLLMILVLIGAVFTTGAIVGNSRVEHATLSSRVENNQLQSLLISSLSDVGRCSWQLTSAANTTDGNVKVDVSALTTPGPTPISPTVLNYKTIYFGTSTAAPILASINQVVPASATQRVVEKIQLANIVNKGPGQFQGDLRIHLSSPNKIASAPIQVPIGFNVNPADPPSAARVVGCTSQLAAAPPSTGGPPKMFVAMQRVPPNKDGGDPGSTHVWSPRILNTTAPSNNIPGAVLSAGGTITLPPGTYRLNSNAIADSAGHHQTRWMNLSTGTPMLLGSLEFADNSNGDGTPSIIDGIFVVSATQQFQLQHIFSDHDTGCKCVFGGAAWGSTDNVYAIVKIELL